MLGDFLGLLANRLGLARAQRVDLRAHRMTAVVRRLDVEQPLARMLEALDGRHFRHARAFERYRRSAAWMVTCGTHWLSWLSPSAREWLGASEASALRPCGVWLQFHTSRVCAPQAIEVYDQTSCETSSRVFPFVCGIVPPVDDHVMVIGGTANPYGAEGEFLEVHLMSPFPSHPRFTHAR